LFYEGLEYFFVKELIVPENLSVRKLTTEELQEKLRAVSTDNTLTCEQIQQFATENDVALESMRPLVEAAGIAILGCRGACS
jgi:hypothetical protein